MSMIEGIWAVRWTLSAPPCHPCVGHLESCSHPAAMMAASCRLWPGLVSSVLGWARSPSSHRWATTPLCGLSALLARLAEQSLALLGSSSPSPFALFRHLLTPISLAILVKLRAVPLIFFTWVCCSSAVLQGAADRSPAVCGAWLSSLWEEHFSGFTSVAFGSCCGGIPLLIGAGLLWCASSGCGDGALSAR